MLMHVNHPDLGAAKKISQFPEFILVRGNVSTQQHRLSLSLVKIKMNVWF